MNNHHTAQNVCPMYSKFDMPLSVLSEICCILRRLLLFAATLDFIQNDPGLLPRAGVITVAGLGGIVAGYRRELSIMFCLVPKATISRVSSDH